MNHVIFSYCNLLREITREHITLLLMRFLILKSYKCFIFLLAQVKYWTKHYTNVRALYNLNHFDRWSVWTMWFFAIVTCSEKILYWKHFTTNGLICGVNHSTMKSISINGYFAGVIKRRQNKNGTKLDCVWKQSSRLFNQTK